jgi:uncharacterized protein DUF1918
MTAHVGDEIMIMSQMLHQPVREGEIREVRDGPGGAIYLVRWDTGHESLLWPGPDAVIKHLHGCGTSAREAVTTSL